MTDSVDPKTKTAMFKLLHEDVINSTSSRSLCLCNDVLESNGLFTCTECGKVLNRATDAFSSDSQPSNAPQLIQKASLGTNIQGKSYLSTVNRWGIWMNNYKEKTYLAVVEYIRNTCRHKIPNAIIDKSIVFYKEINEARQGSEKLSITDRPYVIIRGLNKKSIIAATVLYASRLTSHPLNNFEVADLFNISLKSLTKGEKLFYKLCSVKARSKILSNDEVALFTKRYVDTLRLSEEVTAKALETADNATRIEQTILMGAPSLQALVCIIIAMEYMGSDTIDHRLASQVSCYSENILKKSVKSAKKFKNILCDTAMTDEWIRTSSRIRERVAAEFI